LKIDADAAPLQCSANGAIGEGVPGLPSALYNSSKISTLHR